MVIIGELLVNKSLKSVRKALLFNKNTANHAFIEDIKMFLDDSFQIFEINAKNKKECKGLLDWILNVTSKLDDDSSKFKSIETL